MSKVIARVFSREFKLEVVRRMEAGTNISALARELGIRRRLLNQWRERSGAAGRRRCAGSGGRARRRWRGVRRRHGGMRRTRWRRRASASPSSSAR
jgi:transposase-like protein